MEKPRTGLDERACWQLIADLYDTANDFEAQTLEDLLVRSKWTWKCEAPGDCGWRRASRLGDKRIPKYIWRKHCGAVNSYDSPKCCDCGALK